jgi:hypothetical protein
MKALSRGIDWLENVVISVAIFTSIAISGVGVFFRYVVGSSLSWVEESAGFFLLIVIVVGIGAAVKKGAHLRVDIIHHFFPKTKIPLDIRTKKIRLEISRGLIRDVFGGDTRYSHLISYSSQAPCRNQIDAT